MNDTDISIIEIAGADINTAIRYLAATNEKYPELNLKYPLSNVILARDYIADLVHEIRKQGATDE